MRIVEGTSKCLSDTVSIYREAVDYLIRVVNSEWDSFSVCINGDQACHVAERFVHKTRNRAVVKYDFDSRFYKFPSYLRRSAIHKAFGLASSYHSNLDNWLFADPNTRGKHPSVPKAGYSFPVLYRNNMFISGKDYTAQIKVFRNNTWDWTEVRLRKSDVDYVHKRCKDFKASSPALVRRGKVWSLDIAYTTNSELNNTPIRKQRIVAVDLGINSACVCSVMHPDGTVVGRRLLRLPAENDSLEHALGRIRNAQRLNARRCPRLWARADGINKDIASKTAGFIIDTAMMYNADVIVMEGLDTGRKKRGSKKQRLHHWKAQSVQAMVEGKAHRLGMRISRVSARNTSRLAFDGSGEVKRGRYSEKTGGNHSLCEFQNGKVYHCDLSASYNIGARYFIRELLKSVGESRRLQLEAKVPSVCKRSTCTLSDLISLDAALVA